MFVSFPSGSDMVKTSTRWNVNNSNAKHLKVVL